MTARIFILAPNYATHYNSCHEDFRREICRQRPGSILYGNRHNNWAGDTLIPRVVKKHGKFDYMIISHFKHLTKFYGIDEVDIPRVGLPMDYFPWTHKGKDYQIRKWGLNYLIVRQRWAYAAAKRQIEKGQLPKKLKVLYLPFSVNTKRFFPSGVKDLAVSCAFTTVPYNVYPERAQIIGKLRKVKVKSILRATNKWSDKFIGQKYVDLLSRSKMSVVTTDPTKSVLLKNFEIPACEALLLATHADGLRELGFEDGVNYMQFDSPTHLQTLVKQMDIDDVKRERIAKRGLELVRERHTDEMRVREMLESLEDKLDKH